MFRLCPCYFAVGSLVLLAACEAGFNTDPGGGPALSAPSNLRYQVEPSGTPGAPSGVVLRWTDSGDPHVQAWNVYARAGTSGSWIVRATTASNSYHDRGQPFLQYEVTAIGFVGQESAASNRVTVDERLALPMPSNLTSTSLNRAIALTWPDNSFSSDPAAFLTYRVYGTSYDLDQNLCGATWTLEGTTVAPEFVAGALANGAPHCFAVSAISIEGFESLWSPLRFDTPRPDARNVVVWARQQRPIASGFRFWRDVNADARAAANELGLVGSGNAADIDFSVERDAAGRLWLAPVRVGTDLAVYGAVPVGDLTDIDVAPIGGYSRAQAEAVPGWGYVFRTDGGDGFDRFGAVRTTHVGRDFLILDWAYQTDPGNPELSVGR